jgi:hypothetical protein
METWRRPSVVMVQDLRVMAADVGSVHVWTGGSSLAVFPQASSVQVQPSSVRAEARFGLPP